MSILGNAQTFGSVGSKNLILLQRYESVSDLPASPSDQTLAIISSVNVTGFLWSATQPSPTIEGFVWIYENTHSSTIFHLNNQQLDFYPAGAMQVQTVDNVLTWVSVPLHAFVNNAWKQVRYDILKDGIFDDGGAFSIWSVVYMGTPTYDANEKAIKYVGAGVGGDGSFIGNLFKTTPIYSQPYTSLVFKIRGNTPTNAQRCVGYINTVPAGWGMTSGSPMSVITFKNQVVNVQGGNIVDLYTSLSDTYMEVTVPILNGANYIYLDFTNSCKPNNYTYYKDIYMI